jgi:hypothetical protein
VDGKGYGSYRKSERDAPQGASDHGVHEIRERPPETEPHGDHDQNRSQRGGQGEAVVIAT